MIAGYTGTQRRATYTCVGDTVNLAARLEAHTKVTLQPILIDECTYHSLSQVIQVVSLRPTHIKELSPDVSIYSVPVGQKT